MAVWDIQSISAWSSVLGLSVVGAVTYAIRFVQARRQMVELESYLRMRKSDSPKSYQHSLTRDQIEKAARRSSRIHRIPRQDTRGIALPYLLEWKGKP